MVGGPRGSVRVSESKNEKCAKSDGFSLEMRYFMLLEKILFRPRGRLPDPKGGGWPRGSVRNRIFFFNFKLKNIKSLKTRKDYGFSIMYGP